MKRPNKTAEPDGVWASSQFSEGRGEGSTHRANLCELGEDGLPPATFVIAIGKWLQGNRCRSLNHKFWGLERWLL